MSAPLWSHENAITFSD